MNIATAIIKLNSNIGSVSHVDGVWKAVDHDEKPVSFDLDAATKYSEEQTAKETHIYPRKMEYPTIEEQMDLLWHAIDADADLKTKLGGFYDAIKAVKAKYPKPS